MRRREEDRPSLPTKAFAGYDPQLLFENLLMLTVNEVAEQLGKQPQTIRNWAALGKIPYIPGRPIMFRATAIAAWLAQREKQPWQ